jgi:hypothetical protein
MRKAVSVSTAFGTLGLAALASVSHTSAVAHEGHQMECTETSINAMNSDIQAMDDGETKTTAMKEVQLAQDMMAKNYMEACKTHLHSAMEAIEKQ